MQLFKISQKMTAYVVMLGIGLGISSLPLLAGETLDLALRSNVTISLKDGKQISGVRLVDIDNQSIKFEKGGNSGTREINQVKSIAFEGDYEIKTERGIVVRGEGLKGCSEQKMTIPVAHFKVESKTQAKINLVSLPTVRRIDIIQTSRVRGGFVVNQLQFDGKGAIDVLAAACAAQ